MSSASHSICFTSPRKEIPEPFWIQQQIKRGYATMKGRMMICCEVREGETCKMQEKKLRRRRNLLGQVSEPFKFKVGAEMEPGRL
jgi:hypothetical protein